MFRSQEAAARFQAEATRSLDESTSSLEGKLDEYTRYLAENTRSLNENTRSREIKLLENTRSLENKIADMAYKQGSTLKNRNLLTEAGNGNKAPMNPPLGPIEFRLQDISLDFFILFYLRM